MDGHELDLAVGDGLLRIGEQRHVLHVVLQRGLLPATGLVFVDGLLELRQVVEPLLAAFRAQHGLIAALVHQFRKQFGDGHGLGKFGESLDQIDKLRGFRALEDLVVQVVLQAGVQTRPLFLRGLFQVLHAPLPQIALGHVGDAPEAQVVPVGQHAQVRERVLHLLAVEELHAAVDLVGDLLFKKTSSMVRVI